MRCRPFFLALFLAGTLSSAFARPVWIDTDVSIGSPLREVDDAFALVLAFHSPELRIAGISTSYGNAGRSDADRVALNMVRRFGSPAHLSDQNVFSGARSPGDLGKATPATQALATALQKQSLTYIAIGPLTNLATFLQLHPALAPRIERIVFVGGAVPGEGVRAGPHGIFPVHDANVLKDPRAVEIVLRCGIPLLLAPIATGRRLALTERQMKELGTKSNAGRFLETQSRTWLWFWTTFSGAEGAPVFDALAILAAARPEICRPAQVRVQMQPDKDLRIDRKPGRRSAISALLNISPEATRILLQRLRSR